MANFLFYRYKFVQGPTDASLFPMDSDEHVSGELHNRRLAEDLLSKATSGTKRLTLYANVKERNGDTQTENYENDILNYHDGVFMLHVRNNKHKKVIPIDRLEELDVPHYPYTLVIVDARPGCQAILVQQKKSAFNNPDAVARLVAEYYTRELELSKFGLKVGLQQRLCKGSIWDVEEVLVFSVEGPRLISCGKDGV